MFLDPLHEKIFYDTIAAYQQEFGADKVIIIFPKSWARLMDIEQFKPSQVHTRDAPAVGIRITNGEANIDIPVMEY